MKKALILLLIISCSFISNGQKECIVLQYFNHENSDTSILKTQYFNQKNQLTKEDLNPKSLTESNQFFYIKSNNYSYLDTLLISSNSIYDGPHNVHDSIKTSEKHDSLNINKETTCKMFRTNGKIHEYTVYHSYLNGKLVKTVLPPDSSKLNYVINYSYTDSTNTSITKYSSEDWPTIKIVTSVNSKGKKIKEVTFSNDKKDKEVQYYYDSSDRLRKEVIKLKHKAFSITNFYKYSW